MTGSSPPKSPPRRVGAYLLFEPLGSGGMATVHLGREAGHDFARAVAIKEMHAHLASDPALSRMFLDEARIASRIRHPNVVATLDLCREGDHVLLVMDLVVGETLAGLARATRGEPVPIDVAVAIALDVLAGLEAAHEATDERGNLLGVVHRDVSPHNVLVGADGIARVVDFGIATSEARVVQTRTGELRGKVAYMPPERIAGADADRRTDVYAAAVVFWELCAGRRLYEGDDVSVAGRISLEVPPSLSSLRDDVPLDLSRVVERALSRAPELRFATAADFANALADAAPRATSSKVAAWVARLVPDALEARRARVVAIESESAVAARGSDDASSSSTIRTPETTPSRTWIVALAVAAAATAAVYATVRAFPAGDRSGPPVVGVTPPPPDVAPPGDSVAASPPAASTTTVASAAAAHGNDAGTAAPSFVAPLPKRVPSAAGLPTATPTATLRVSPSADAGSTPVDPNGF